MLKIVLATGFVSAGPRRPSRSSIQARGVLPVTVAIGADYTAVRPESGECCQLRTQIAFIFWCLSVTMANETC